MNALPGVLVLQAAPPGPDFTMFIPMIAIFGIFYLLLIRPQQRRQREHEKTLAAIEKGDRVVTSGGLHGTVTGVTDDVLTVEIAALKGERVRVKISRARIDTVQKGGKPEDET